MDSNKKAYLVALIKFSGDRHSEYDSGYYGTSSYWEKEIVTNWREVTEGEFDLLLEWAAENSNYREKYILVSQVPKQDIGLILEDAQARRLAKESEAKAKASALKEKQERQLLKKRKAQEEKDRLLYQQLKDKFESSN